MTRFLRASLSLVVIVIVVPLLGASTGFAPPVVVVYPITSSGGIARAAGGNLSLVIATKIAQLGGVTVKPSTPGTERASFLDAAIAAGADYYITGFITPIGAESSLITQVVSTHSGSVVFSTTGTVKTYADALAQVDVLHAAILRHAGRGLAALDAPSPAPSSSPPLTANGSVDIGRALRKRKRATPAPSPVPSIPSSILPAATPQPIPGVPGRSSSAPTATSATVATQSPASVSARPLARAAPAPQATAAGINASNTALLFAIDGTLGTADTSLATRAILDGFIRANRPTAFLGVALGGNLARAAAICGANPGTHELDAASIIHGTNENGTARVRLDISAYDCSGTRLRTQRATATASGTNGLHDAIVKAVAEATRAFAGVARP